MRKSPFPLMSAQHYLHNTPGQSVITTLRSCADASPSPRAETLAQSFSPQCCTANTQHGSNGTQQRAKGLQGAERSATAPLHTNPHSCKAKGAQLPCTLLWGPCLRGAHPLVPARGVTEHTVPLCASIVTWKFGNGRLMQQEDTSHAIHPSTTGSTAMAHPTHVQECGALQQRWI